MHNLRWLTTQHRQFTPEKSPMERQGTLWEAAHTFHLLVVGHKTELVVLEVCNRPIQHNSVIVIVSASCYLISNNMIVIYCNLFSHCISVFGPDHFPSVICSPQKWQPESKLLAPSPLMTCSTITCHFWAETVINTNFSSIVTGFHFKFETDFEKG